MEWKFKKNEKWNKVILVVLCGILLLVIVMPQKTVHDLVTERFTDLADTKRDFLTGCSLHILEVYENTLCCFRS